MSPVAETDQNQLRAQHYVFAHYTLREEAFEATGLLLNALANQDRDYMRDQWFKAMVRCRMSDLPIDVSWFPLEAIHISTSKHGDLTCHVISMPQPKHVTEVFFAAVLESQDEGVRYYTLEKGFQNDGTPGTVFCEWTRAGSHLNHGGGPPATVEDFTDSILRHINPELFNDR